MKFAKLCFFALGFWTAKAIFRRGPIDGRELRQRLAEVCAPPTPREEMIERLRKVGAF